MVFIFDDMYVVFSICVFEVGVLVFCEKFFVIDFVDVDWMFEIVCCIGIGFYIGYNMCYMLVIMLM